MTPGVRLSRARKQNGYETRKDLLDITAENGNWITETRPGRLERNEVDPTIQEVIVLCDVLHMSADWWLRGDEASADVIFRRLMALPVPIRKFALGMIDQVNRFKRELIAGEE